MALFRGNREAFGKPGIEPRWTHGNKDGVGTAYAGGSHLWYTIFRGVVTEVYYPGVDRPQVRDLQYLIGDGEALFHEEKRDLESHIERLSPHGLGYRITNSDPAGRYSILKEVIADPHLPCLLQQTQVIGDAGLLSKLKLYALCAPHLEVGGAGNNGYVIEAGGREILAAHKGETWLVMGATAPFSKLSCGYVGRSDGWTDLADNFRMDWEFDQALDGNLALTGELEMAACSSFTLGLAFGHSLHSAVTRLFQSLALPFEQQRQRFTEQWERPHLRAEKLDEVSGDAGSLYRGSYSLLLAHEDKNYPGAFIASLSIPWGEAKGDEDQGGYHLVWTRDMVQTATGLLAAGNRAAPLRALIYLAASQGEDGNFPQNFWVDGQPYWRGIQLDEVAFPVLLAWRLDREQALADFDPYPLVLRAARFLVLNGPATLQERWEELSGYSPSTLASSIAALICAAGYARQRGEAATAQFLEEYADFLECHIEAWTVTRQGTLVPGMPCHYIRILPAAVDNQAPREDPDTAVVTLHNSPPGVVWRFAAKEIVDPGFLELVRYGIRKPDDPLIVDSLRVVDEVLKVETRFGPCWHRYNHDGYGQREDGSAYTGWGKGRAWPLLTGERGHYELAAGRDPKLFLRALEGFASATGLLPEQVWDEKDLPAMHMCLGRPTGSAMPLMWAHAEYIKLLRSIAEGRVFDFIPQVAERYCQQARPRSLEVWKPNRHARSVRAGSTLRIQAASPFRLHWSNDEWRTANDTDSSSALRGIDFVDIPVAASQRAPLRFTFYWPATGCWEGRDYQVDVFVAA